MKLIITIIFLLSTNIVLADTVNFDASQWTQDQKNMTKAMTVSLLFNNNITYSDVKVTLPSVEVINPSGSITSILTQANIESKYTSFKATLDANNAIRLAEENEKQTEIQNNVFKDVTLTQVDSYIDDQVNAINNLADAKVFLKAFLKKLVRYLKAKE